MSRFRRVLLVLSLMLLIVIGACSNSDDKGTINDATNDSIVVDDERSTNSEPAETDDTKEVLDREEIDVSTDSKEIAETTEDEVVENKANENKSVEATKKLASTSKDKSSDKKQTTASPKNDNKNPETKKSKIKKSDNKKTETPKKKENSKAEKPKEPVVEKKLTVTLSISVPSGVTGPSYGPTEIEFNSGDTVYDVLLKSGMAPKARGNGPRTYVYGIDGLEEFDEGPLSGWNYKVDGVMLGNSAGSHEVAEGQKIEWIYTVDFTE